MSSAIMFHLLSIFLWTIVVITTTTPTTRTTAIATVPTTTSSSESSNNKAEDETNNNNNPNLLSTKEIRKLQSIDFFNPSKDICNNAIDPLNDIEDLGPCDITKFPNCENGKTQICYNRKPSRTKFHPLTHQPFYFIQYDRVFCYPNNWGGCSSCTPGRYCVSEQSCILNELNYPCEQWF